MSIKLDQSRVISNMKRINFLGLVLGLIAVQALSGFLGIVFTILSFVLYGNAAFVAMVEHPSSMVVIVVSTIASCFLGGYVSMTISEDSILNPLLTGVLTLIFSVSVTYELGLFGASLFGTILIISCALIVPSAWLGGYFFLKRHA